MLLLLKSFVELPSWLFSGVWLEAVPEGRVDFEIELLLLLLSMLPLPALFLFTIFFDSNEDILKKKKNRLNLI